MIYCCSFSFPFSFRLFVRRFSIFQTNLTKNAHPTKRRAHVCHFVCIIENAIKLFYYFILLQRLHSFKFVFCCAENEQYAFVRFIRLLKIESMEWHGRTQSAAWIAFDLSSISYGHSLSCCLQSLNSYSYSSSNNNNSNHNEKQLIILIHISLMEEAHNKGIIFNFIRIVMYRSVRLCCQWRLATVATGSHYFWHFSVMV